MIVRNLICRFKNFLSSKIHFYIKEKFERFLSQKKIKIVVDKIENVLDKIKIVSDKIKIVPDNIEIVLDNSFVSAKPHFVSDNFFVWDKTHFVLDKIIFLQADGMGISK